MNPVPGTTLETSAGTLGLHHPQSPQSGSSTSPSSDGEHDGPSKGLLTKAFDKLSRSKSGLKSEKKSSDGSTKPKRVRITGLSRKGRNSSGLDDTGIARSDSVRSSSDVEAGM